MQEEAFNGVIKYVRLSALRVLDDGEKACTSNDARLYWLEMNMTMHLSTDACNPLWGHL